MLEISFCRISLKIAWSSSLTGTPSTFLTVFPSLKIYHPPTIATIQAVEISNPVTHPGRLNRFRPHITPQRIICKNVLTTNAQMTRSSFQYKLGGARSPVNGALGVRFTGSARVISLTFAGTGSVSGWNLGSNSSEP